MKFSNWLSQFGLHTWFKRVLRPACRSIRERQRGKSLATVALEVRQMLAADAVDDTYTVSLGQSTGTVNVMANDTPLGSLYFMGWTSTPSVPGLTLNSNGTFQYSASSLPYPNPITFGYQVYQNSMMGMSSDTATVTINVSNPINQKAPSFVNDPYSWSVAANASQGASVGTPVVTDPDANDTKTFTLVPSYPGVTVPFAVDPGTGQVTVNGTLSPYAYYMFSIRVTDSFGLTDTAQVTISVSQPAYSAPSFDHDPYLFSVSSSASTGTAVGTVHASDADVGDIVTYSFSYSMMPGPFQINSSTGVVTTTGPLVAGTTYNVSVMAYDTHTLYDFVNLTITVTDSAPVIVNSTVPSYLDEATGIGTLVGAIQATDADGHSITYSILPPGNATYTPNIPGQVFPFSINANTGEISVIDSLAGLLQIGFVVRATDST